MIDSLLAVHLWKSAGLRHVQGDELELADPGWHMRNTCCMMEHATCTALIGGSDKTCKGLGNFRVGCIPGSCIEPEPPDGSKPRNTLCSS
eukprot:1014304-Pelagomonas_calceolata.AAC.6